MRDVVFAAAPWVTMGLGVGSMVLLVAVSIPLVKDIARRLRGSP